MIDYVFRVLGFEYLNRTDLAHVINEAPTGELIRHAHATEMPVGREHLSATNSTAESRMPEGARMRMVEGGEDTVAMFMVEQNKRMLGDAPACDSCGHITIRNGTCYKCVNCVSSMGCS